MLIGVFNHEVVSEGRLDLVDLVRYEVDVEDKLFLSLSEFVLQFLSVSLHSDFLVVDLAHEAVHGVAQLMDQLQFVFCLKIVIVQLKQPLGGVREVQLDFFELRYSDFLDISLNLD